MTTQIAEKHALKEWAVAIKAIDEGQQIVLLRKGGIREKEFKVEHENFLLYPTYEHQKEDLLKPEYSDSLKETLVEWEGPEGEEVKLTHWVRVTHVFEVMDTDKVAAISPYFMWTDDYAEKRLHWRPKKPLEILLIRAYRLLEPQPLHIEPHFVGCKSWIDLESPVPMTALTPVLTDEEYEAKVKEITDALSF